MRIYSNENEKEIELIIKERIKDFNEMFRGCYYLYNIVDSKNLYVSKVIKFYSMFEKCNQLENLESLINLNVSNEKKISVGIIN